MYSVGERADLSQLIMRPCLEKSYRTERTILAIVMNLGRYFGLRKMVEKDWKGPISDHWRELIVQSMVFLVTDPLKQFSAQKKRSDEIPNLIVV